MLQTINVIDRVILILKYLNVINGINLSDKPEGENCKGGGRKGFVEASVPLNTLIIIIIIITITITITIIIIIITRPWPAFGRLGLGGSSGGYSSHE